MKKIIPIVHWAIQLKSSRNTVCKLKMSALNKYTTIIILPYLLIITWWIKIQSSLKEEKVIQNKINYKTCL